MKGGTMFSGIGAPECAAPWIDWRWCAEIDPFPAAVHAARFPGVVNHGDVTKVAWDAVEPVDVVVWGSPCQAFSVAGRRAGLDDPRGDLTLVGLAALGRVRPRWMVWENVPGVLSIDGGRTFGTVLGLMGELGYGVAYRVLNAQHFGVPQRRRRVFVVGCLGDWRRAAAVLFERDCLSGNSAPGREAREDVARPLAAGSPRGSGYRNDADTAENLIAFDTTQVTSKANRSNPRPGDPCHPLAAGAHAPAIAHCLNAHPSRRIDGESETFVVTPPLTRNPYGDHESREGLLIAHTIGTRYSADEDGTGRGTPLVPVAFGWQNSPSQGASASASASVTPTLDKSKTPGISDRGGFVRRLLPVECERLQGFPDQWTAVTYRGKPAADGPRYKALGNSMAVPVLAWLLDRIRRVDAIKLARAAA
jgi:DNA (cytosine-5)-methyltransferase 1